MGAIKAGVAAPDFTLTNLEGQPVQLAQLRGAPLLLNFYNSTCSWCQMEMPRLADVYRRQADVDVQVLGIVTADDEATAAAFAKDKRLDFPSVLDSEHQVCADYAVERVPTLVLVNAEGVVDCVYEGASEQLAGVVEQTMLAAARGDELPEYRLIGNGCGPN
ncbi:MAG TPA: TlpA disulfide reductase family protein [Abditibacteriaceae bacterium]|nr:TlpA disulfide reductase family protein [Abditibacteriaceae bacterium]